MIKLNENDLINVHNVSICLDHYEDFCGKTIPVEMSKKIKCLHLNLTSFICLFF